MTIAHAFNHRMAVLRDGVKSAFRVGRSRKAEGRFLSGSDIPWDQQVAVMFQIVSTVALELPSFLAELENLRGISPNVHLHCKPWGLVPFVSDRPGVYGRLLLTVFMRWRTGLFVSSNWLWPVTRGGWRAGFPDRGCGSADVS